MHYLITTVAGEFIIEADTHNFTDSGWVEFVNKNNDTHLYDLVVAYSQYPTISFRPLTDEQYRAYTDDVVDEGDEPESEENEQDAYDEHMRKYIMGIGQPKGGGIL
jgi:hypothetical protein